MPIDSNTKLYEVIHELAKQIAKYQQEIDLSKVEKLLELQTDTRFRTQLTKCMVELSLDPAAFYPSKERFPQHSNQMFMSALEFTLQINESQAEVSGEIRPVEGPREEVSGGGEATLKTTYGDDPLTPPPLEE